MPSLVGVLVGVREQVGAAELGGLDDGQRLLLAREIELLTRALAALSVRVQAGFYASQVAVQVADGVGAGRAGAAAGDDLAVARMTSPYRASRELCSARALTREMPATLAALAGGVITGEQARVITEATTCLDPADRAEIDTRLADRLPGMPPNQLRKSVDALVYELDPAGYVARARKAATDRGVSLRPAPDVMGLLSARLPAPEATAAFASLQASARAKRASGDPRTIQQLMADELYARLTGRSVVDGIDVQVGLVITDTALLAGTSDPADLIGYGPIPADLARDLLRPTHPDPATQDDHDDQHDPDDPGGQGEANATVPDRGGSSQTGAASHGGREAEDALGDPVQDPAVRARADAAANAAGFPGGRVPAGYCPAGGRCTSASCTLTHGHPDTPTATGPPTPDLSTLTTPPTPRQAATQLPQPGAAPATQRSPEREPAPGAARARAATVWLRRLYTDPVTGLLTGRDTRRRLFTGAVREFVVARDRYCANTWCGAPIRHLDHIHRHHQHGPTSPENGRGLCARCNLARERPRHLDPDHPDPLHPTTTHGQGPAHGQTLDGKAAPAGTAAAPVQPSTPSHRPPPLLPCLPRHPAPPSTTTHTPRRQ